MHADEPAGAASGHAAATPAWLLRDVTHVPGVLSLDGDRCRFVSTRRVVFDATPDELALAASRTRRGRFSLTLDGERVGLSVVRPAGAVAVPAELLSPSAGSTDTGTDPATDVAERLLDVSAAGRRRPGTATGVRRGAARARGSRRGPRVWRAVVALVPRLPSSGSGHSGGPGRGDPSSPMATA